MVGLPLGSLSNIMVGNDSGWALSFHKEQAGRIFEEPVLLVGRESYYAQIEATLPNGELSGASYRFTIEGLVDSDYRMIAQTGSSAPSVVRLYLYWRDTNESVGAFFANLGGLTDLFSSFSLDQLQPALVAELAITRVSRQLGERRYETVVAAAERVSKQLARRMTEPLEVTGFRAAVLAIDTAAFGRGANAIVPYMNEVADAATAAKLNQELVKYKTGTLYRDALRDLAKRFEQASGKRGRGMMLVRKGVLHWGVRPIPLERGAPKKLDLASGLIETQVVGSVSANKNFESADASSEPRRSQFKLTLKGRPDIFPGDVVSFVLPPEEMGDTASAALTAAVSGVGSLVASLHVDSPATKAYVESVVHRLGRTASFSTLLNCIEIKPSGDDGWDTPSPSPSREHPTDSGSNGSHADHAAQAAEGVNQVAAKAAGAVETIEVGEVRTVTTSGTSESAGPLAQTLKLWEGLVSPDGLANQARRLQIRRAPPLSREAVSYSTPFGWGKCGLVLPRYPGTRVVMTYRNGEMSDPIDIGTIWESGKGPTNAKAGDWWLTLPAAVPANQRETIPDSDQPPADYNGKVTDDLIDADGARVIQVGGMTIRVGMDGLGTAGTRPDPTSLVPADTLTLQHADGKASIVLKKGGEILIKADKITLQAQGVKAELASDMNVS